jgi:nucleoporin SEH1
MESILIPIVYLSSMAEPKNSQKRWAEKFRLVESRGSVQDIEFAPGNGSLRLV